MNNMPCPKCGKTAGYDLSEEVYKCSCGYRFVICQVAGPDEVTIPRTEFDRLCEAEGERDELRTQLAERDAECAAMREALEYVKEMARLAIDIGQTPTYSEWLRIVEKCETVLPSSAGKDLLERLHKAEGDNERTRSLLRDSISMTLPCPTCDPKCQEQCDVRDLNDAIDAFLKEGDGR